VSEVEPAARLADALGLPVAGLDEAGRGPLAGPVVAAAVVLVEPIEGLNDSKKLTEKKRDELFDRIWAEAAAVGVGIAEPPEIDEINILRASLGAMASAFLDCERKLTREIGGAVVDGNQLAPLPERVTQETIVGGDRKSPAIMAASIIAKVTRDRRMIEEAARYPGYGFEKHKGYPTPAHRAALQQLGPTAIHRRSFAPVRAAMQATIPET
jgi:ribonuclease HII